MDTREKIIQENMGKMVHVVVDRPIGYLHGDILYPVNYGYIPGLIAGDGEEQDAYILGIEEPLAEFDGRVIAAVRRQDDCEDKLVVAPDGVYFHQSQIREAVHFQEQYFISTVDAFLQKSCGVIPFRYRSGEKEYLVLLQTNNCWSFPKGHMEPGETEEETALRELKEETGLTADLIPGIRILTEYDMHNRRRKQVALFPGEVQGEVTLQPSEIRDYRWVRAEDLKNLLHPDTYAACREWLED